MSQRLILFTLTFLLTCITWAKNPWEVTVVFLSSSDDETVYQTDIDANLMELARLIPSAELRLTVARLWPHRNYIFQPDANASGSAPFKALFEAPPPMDVEIQGNFIETKGSESPSDFLLRALKLGFSAENNQRLLIVQTHGFGPKGIKQLKTQEFKKLLGNIPLRTTGKPLDILWMDSCFMMNLEFAFELKGFAHYMISSEDSEFSTGAPFDALAAISEEDLSPIALARAMAQQFIESYSIVSSGSQRRAVFSSAATVSLIETSKLDQVVKLSSQFSQDIKKLSPKDRTKLNRSLRSVQMELNHLVDFGRLMQKAKASVKVASAVPLLKLFEISNPAKLGTNARVKVQSEIAGSQLVYGYDRFTKGDETDADTLEKIPKNLSPIGFVPGPNNKSWPFRVINKLLYLTPFAPGLNSFSYYLKNVGFESPVTTVRRLGDYVFRTRLSSENPVVFVGYTQGVGKAAEKYTGLGVLNPLLPKPDLDYMRLEFVQQTRWGM